MCSKRKCLRKATKIIVNNITILGINFRSNDAAKRRNVSDDAGVSMDSCKDSCGAPDEAGVAYEVRNREECFGRPTCQRREAAPGWLTGPLADSVPLCSISELGSNGKFEFGAVGSGPDGLAGEGQESCARFFKRRLKAR
jgi:hypothetical protein